MKIHSYKCFKETLYITNCHLPILALSVMFFLGKEIVPTKYYNNHMFAIHLLEHSLLYLIAIIWDIGSYIETFEASVMCMSIMFKIK